MFKLKNYQNNSQYFSLVIHELVQKYSDLSDYVRVSRCLEVPEEGTGSFGYTLLG